ncbi:trans-aconitate 2-methyltransferase [Acerihabitans arboris]|uniref:Trans-aconitate 2-methyltransferase n=1 Tax=Acerihabitans arboris TaxID=2691583 RepID=A0A845SBX5_9GAMM|nr:trans-aconitate 2-methyltransferase [Acerihabitans arboris]NDL62343.1 trans-aconitate 2-methyltransferase [Acerihabitans arboris]
MPDWNPELYRQFEAERTRPALELLSRIPLTSPARITDLGCGPGNSTQGLQERFAQAVVAGIDSSAAMLDSARQRLPQCRFSRDDIATWRPAAAQDIIYANASLQWVPDHQTLFPRLFSLTAPGGCLAVQMPDNREEPSHREMRRIAGEAPWRQHIGDTAAVRVKVLSAEQYYDLLAPDAESVDIWRTTYFHVMPSADAIVEWVRATGLRPFVERLDEDLRSTFITRYRQALQDAYPARAGGTVLLAFPRLFIVAGKAV